MLSRDSWLQHGPAFAGWPAIVFLVSLQFTARSILPRHRHLLLPYFSGAQHGVARQLRGAWLLPLPARPVPRRQRENGKFALLSSFLCHLPPCSRAAPSSSHSTSSAGVTRSRELAFSCIRVHRRRSSCPVAATIPPRSHSPRRSLCVAVLSYP